MVRAAALIFLASCLGACGPSQPDQTFGERTKKACDEQFGVDTPSSADCQVKLALKAEEKTYSDKQRAAERAAGE